MSNYIGLLGILLFIVIAFMLSEKKKAVSTRIIAGGVFLQLAMALFVLKSDLGKHLVDQARVSIQAILSLSDKGAEFVFGTKFVEHQFAFSVLPTIIFVSSLSYVLFYFGILQRVVGFLAIIIGP